MYAGPDGESHFEDVDLDLTPGAGGAIPKCSASTGMMFRKTMPDYDVSWHPAPRRYFIINVEGHVELQVSDGERRNLVARGASFWPRTPPAKATSAAPLTEKKRLSVFVNVPA